MAQLSASRIFNALAGLFSSTDSTDEALLKTALWRKTIHCHVTDGGTAGTAQTETVVWRNDTGATVKVVSAHVIAPVAVTANATNYATFLVYKRSSAGASQATIGTFATDTVTNVEVAAGAVITCAVTKTAAGVAIAAATSQARVQIVVEPIGS
jgi:hypothetical protein